jgi:putative transposase
MTVMVTRRTLRRTHLLRPDAALSQLYLFCLGVLAARHGILVHAVVLMSTHEHLVLTDPQGRLPLFLRELHRLVALGVKVLRNWEGAVWDHERPSVVQLRTPEAVIEALGYLMANPVAAGLVRFAKDWPGIRTLPEHLGRACFKANRPAQYFDAHSPQWPAHVELKLQMPSLPGLSDEEIRSAVARELAERETQALADVRAEGRAVLGSDRVCKVSPYNRAKSWEPLRGRNPQFAVGRGQRAAFVDAVATLRAFRRMYREALDRWRAGLRDVCFPAGTWLMRMLHAAAVAAPA